MKTLGDRIRELREAKDLSLREFAKTLSLSAAFVSDVELGRRYPSGRVLVRMAQILETSHEELRKFDTRVPVEEIKRLASDNPAFGLAFRSVVGKNVTPEDLIQLAESKGKRAKREK
ncbi:MAG: helix-turn-helix transcriptional regulator [Bacteroidota bacterium]